MSKTHYILIERDAHHLSAVTREVLADMKARGESILSERPVTKADIKRDRIHVINAAWYFEYAAWGDWKTLVHEKTFKAKVLWFNLNSGNGMVEIPELDKRLPLYACNIPGKKTWFPETACVFYEVGEAVDVRLEVYPGQTFVIGLTEGYRDNIKWESLDQSNLAFKCDESGKATNGLFA